MKQRTKLEHCSRGSSKTVQEMAVASLATNASCLWISVLICRKTTSDGITDEAFVLEGYSKWKDIDKQGIEYYNLLMHECS